MSLGLDLVEADEGAIGELVSPDELVVLQARGGSHPVMQAEARLRLSEWRPAADAVRTRAPVWLESPGEIRERYSELEPLRQRWGHSAWVFVPLVVEERATGLLGLVYREPHRFDASDRSCIVALGEQCAGALRRAVLHERLERVLERSRALLTLTTALCGAATPREVADALSRAGPVATGATRAHLFRREGSGGLSLLTSAGEGDRLAEPGHRIFDVRSLAAEADRTGALVASDACAAVPILVNGATAGVLGIEYAPPRALGPEDRNHLLCIAAHCAQALHRAMLSTAEAESRRRTQAAEEVLKRMRERAALADELAAALADAGTEAEAAWVVFDLAAERLGAIAGVVTRPNVGGELEVAHRFGSPEDVPTSPDRPDRRGPHAEVVRTGRAMWLPADAEGSACAPALVNALRLRGAAWIAVPLWLQGEPCGTLSLTLAPAPADDQERASLMRLVEQCGRAVSRARITDAERAARRATEAAEAETRRLGSLQEELAAVVAHDLRTPLTAIELCAKTLFADSASTEAQRGKVGRICASVEHIAKIAGTLRDFTQAQLPRGIPLDTGRLDLGNLVRRTVAEMEDAYPGRTLGTSLEGDLTMVGDGGRLVQVLSNLIGNALQHGSIAAPVTVAARGEGGAIVIAVHNEGVPIPPRLLPHLFEPYQQGQASRDRARHTGSMGLGLFIVREIVHAHGGTVSVDSAPESGTTFTVVVPRLPTFSSPTRAAASPSAHERR